jgi:hypothetical protein
LYGIEDQKVIAFESPILYCGTKVHKVELTHECVELVIKDLLKTQHEQAKFWKSQNHTSFT